MATELNDNSSGWGVVSRFITALNRLRLGEVLELTTAEIELETPLTQVWGLQEVGQERVREWFLRIQREWAFVECYDLRLEEAVGDGWVLGRMRVRGRGKASRSEVSWAPYIAARIVEGRIASFGAYLNREIAVATIEGAQGDPPGVR